MKTKLAAPKSYGATCVKLDGTDDNESRHQWHTSTGDQMKNKKSLLYCSKTSWTSGLFIVFFVGFIAYSWHLNKIALFSQPIDQQNAEFAEIAAKKTELPHIVFVLIDDQGYNDMGYVGGPLDGLMPNIDKLANTGVKLTKYYSEAICTPARSSLMTGKYPIHTGMQYNVIISSQAWGLPLEYEILPQKLKNDHGYVTRIVGKWHLGFFQPGYLPTNRGFDSHFGYLGGQEHYYTHQFPEEGDIWIDWQRDGHPVETDTSADDGYSLTLFADEVDEILENHDQSQPLFLYYATQATHEPIVKPPKHYLTQQETQKILNVTAKGNPESSNVRKTFMQISVALDKTIGQMVDTLKATGMYDNTIILVASDNGGKLCDQSGGSNYPFRGEKGSQWEGGIHVNGFIHSPLLPEAVRNTTHDHLFHVSDWVPTILHGILGNGTAKGREYDGVNQWDGIVKKGGSKELRQQILHNIEVYDLEKGSFIAAYRNGPYKLIWGESSEPIYDYDDATVSLNCSNVKNYEEWTHIYNIPEDPSETNNIVDEIDDYQLSIIWHAIDGFWDSSVKAEYDGEDDGRWKKVWLDHGGYAVPWIHYKVNQERIHLPVP